MGTFVSGYKKEAAYCYQRAEEARRMSQRATTAKIKRECEALAEQWIEQARSYDFDASLEQVPRNAIGTPWRQCAIFVFGIGGLVVVVLVIRFAIGCYIMASRAKKLKDT